MRKLFWDDPYLAHAQATIQQVDGVEVLLDRTIIYSFAGGQQSDDGTIGGIPVADSKILSGNENIVYSLIEPPSFLPGNSVPCTIDWDKRFQIMKLHSAAHIVMSILYDIKGTLPVIGANVTNEKGRIDFSCNEPLNPLVPKLQEEIDNVVRKNLEIITKTESTSSIGQERIWMIQELGKHWVIPCGGTHPKYTGEIGGLKLKRKNIGAGKERIEISLLADH